MKMNSISILIVSLIAISVFLSGCTESTTKSDVISTPPPLPPTTPTETRAVAPTPVQQPVDTPTLIDTPNQTSKKLNSAQTPNVTQTSNKSANSSRTLSSSTDTSWCPSGTVQLINGKAYVIKGITTFQDKEVCKAVREVQGGVTTRYFSQDGLFENETSTSPGGTATSSSSISITRNQSNQS